MLALVSTIVLGVFYRYVLQNSLFWATEVPNFLFVWIVFLGAVVAYHEKKHIAFTALHDWMAPRNKAKAEIAVHLLILCFALFLVFTGMTVVRQTMDSPSEALKVPLGYLYSVIPFAFTAISIDSALSIWSLVRNQLLKEAQQ
jgi:TRAP-type C4-dicarboxylate transport system permease small subunit